MKKALIITNTSGFLMKFESENVRILQDLGYEVHFASNKYDVAYPFDFRELEALGVVFHHIDIARSPYMFHANSKAYMELVTIIQNEDIDLIHCHTPTGALIGRLAGMSCRRRRKQVTIIYTAHGFHFYKGAPLINQTLFKGVEKLLAHATDQLIVINDEDYKSAQRLRLRKHGKRYLIPGEGLNLDSFKRHDDDHPDQLREKYGISKDVYFLLSVGEMNLNKNHTTVIQAIGKIKEQNPDYPILYGICGDGVFNDMIVRYIEDLGLTDCVKCFGYQANIKDFYLMADATVFPSYREGLGMAAIESLAMGIPVIAADNRGTREYMHDGVNGFVFKPNDVDGLVACIYRYLSMDDNAKIKMEQNCRPSVERFDHKYTNRLMRDIYNDNNRDR